MWVAVLEETVACSFKRCGIMSTLDGSEDGHLRNRLAEINAVAPKDCDGLRDECLALGFGSNLRESFSGFDSD